VSHERRPRYGVNTEASSSQTRLPILQTEVLPRASRASSFMEKSIQAQQSKLLAQGGLLLGPGGVHVLYREARGMGKSDLGGLRSALVSG
jgi:hypothetical protein